MIRSFVPSLHALVLAVMALPTVVGAAPRGAKQAPAPFPLPPLQGGALQIADTGKPASPLILQIKAPLSTMPHDCPVAEVAPDARFRGRLVFTVRTEPTAYIVQQMTGVPDRTGSTGVAAYPTKAYDAIYGAQFSPGGRAILFKVGWPLDSHQRFDLFTWDFASQKLRLMQRSLFVETVRWSPDGKWIAFVKYGDKADRLQNGPDLWTQNVGTGAGRIVARNALDNFRWSGGSTLLVTVPMPKNSALSEMLPRFDTMRVSALRGAPRPFLRDAVEVTPSPDGRWLAFLRWETQTPAGTSGEVKMHPVQMQPLASRYHLPQSPVIFFLNRRTKRYFKVKAMGSGPLVWSPDSKTLLMTNMKSEAGDKGRAGRVATVMAVDVASHTTRIVGTVEAWDFQSAGRGYDSPAIVPKVVSRDGRYLYLDLSEFYGMAGHMYKQLRKIVALDLRTGESETVASLDDPFSCVIGWDWREEPLPASSRERR